MAIFRGVGGSGDSSDNSFLDAVTAQANAASASASAASASASSILNLTAATGAEGTEASYNPSTGVLTIPKGDTGDVNNLTSEAVTNVLTGGTGISVASNGTIANDSPDQTVALTGTGATTVTGTYPNFTIDSTNTTYTIGDGGLTTNDFTDADHTKLNGIEASADVTDTASVTAAGAVMDGDFTSNGLMKRTNAGTYTVDTNTYLTSFDITTQTDPKYLRANTADSAAGFIQFVSGFSSAMGTFTGNINGTTAGFTGDITVGGTVDGRDIAVDGTKLDALEQTFTSRFSHFFNSALYMSTTLTTLGYTYQTKETTNSKNTVDLTLETRHQDLYDTNDAEYYVSLTAPNPSDEDTVYLGEIKAVTSDNTKGKKIGYFNGDKTKYFSEYCGLALIVNGSNGINTNGLVYYYDATNDRTYMGVHLYQSNLFATDSDVWLHPFDWETSGTVLNGRVTPLDAAVYDGIVDSVQTKKHYLGYFKSNVNLEIKAQEPSTNTDGNNVAIKAVEGAINQVQD